MFVFAMEWLFSSVFHFHSICKSTRLNAILASIRLAVLQLLLKAQKVGATVLALKQRGYKKSKACMGY
tara:strand:- start:824 stop:1027 length:204 start_codon:yes stop_codon:yes gene_type:complete